MNCIDVFSGAGGLTEGFIRAGYKIIAHVEKEYPATLTLKTRLAYHYLKSHNSLEKYYEYVKGHITREELYSNIPSKLLDTVINEEINDATLEKIYAQIDNLKGKKEIDIIIGGPPCQAYSLIGRAASKNKMKGDKRKYLYKHYLHFLKRYQPKYFVFENVRGMLSAKDEGGKNIFEKIITEMETLDYKIEYRLLDARDFGVLQSRKRVIIIGWKKNLKFFYPNFEKNCIKGNINNLFRDLPKLNAGEYVNFFKRKKNNFLLKLLHINDDDFGIVSQHIARPHRSTDLEIYKIAVENMNKGKKLNYTELPQNLISHNNLTSFLDRFKVVDGMGISHTMVAHIAKDGHYYIHPDISQNRSLSLREAARIQSFPDSFFFENSRTAAFTQIGNAVPPLMAEIIAKKLYKEILKTE
ncbi:DNA cytosine methyltransferase [Fusobacterium sp. PH5-44]|uniref:DNA cytosine methyltransferase n=1 Tax=unclassified Fusobacterium TaxID=2648384 RepID=UPI003D1E77DF